MTLRGPPCTKGTSSRKYHWPCRGFQVPSLRCSDGHAAPSSRPVVSRQRQRLYVDPFTWSSPIVIAVDLGTYYRYLDGVPKGQFRHGWLGFEAWKVGCVPE